MHKFTTFGRKPVQNGRKPVHFLPICELRLFTVDGWLPHLSPACLAFGESETSAGPIQLPLWPGPHCWRRLWDCGRVRLWGFRSSSSLRRRTLPRNVCKGSYNDSQARRLHHKVRRAQVCLFEWLWWAEQQASPQAHQDQILPSGCLGTRTSRTCAWQREEFPPDANHWHQACLLARRRCHASWRRHCWRPKLLHGFRYLGRVSGRRREISLGIRFFVFGTYKRCLSHMNCLLNTRHDCKWLLWVALTSHP